MALWAIQLPVRVREPGRTGCNSVAMDAYCVMMMLGPEQAHWEHRNAKLFGCVEAAALGNYIYMCVSHCFPNPFFNSIITSTLINVGFS